MPSSKELLEFHLHENFKMERATFPTGLLQHKLEWIQDAFLS